MRKQFVKTIEDILKIDEKLILLLGDIGVFGFRNSFKQYPDRVYNIGILEQSTIGTAAGLAMQGFIPVVHTIAPFIVERSFEQLKNDFGYQKLGGNFVSVGASYDYSSLGCTHHCPGDIGLLKQIPGMEIILPGTASEFDSLFKQTYANGKPSYHRISERKNNIECAVKFGKANIIKKGSKATVIAVGPALEPVMQACKNEDVTILYYTTVSPFDSKTLKKYSSHGKFLLCEPYYSGGLTHDIMETLKPMPITIENVGVPHEFLHGYGKAYEQDEFIGMTPKNIYKKLKKLINE